MDIKCRSACSFYFKDTCTCTVDKVCGHGSLSFFTLYKLLIEQLITKLLLLINPPPLPETLSSTWDHGYIHVHAGVGL